MSKLIFEDDKGKQHNIDLLTVKSKELKKDDVVIVAYEVGDAPTAESSFALTSLNNLLKTAFGDKKVLTIATRNGVRDITIDIISEKDA